MRLADPQQHIGGNVRIRSHGSSQHFGRGRLVGVEGGYGLVRPFGRHRQTERVPLSDIHTWAAGNAAARGDAAVTQASAAEQPAAEVQPEELWVVADVENVRFFASTWGGFKPELSRARIYERLRSAVLAAGRLANRQNVGRLEVLTVEQAKQLIQSRYPRTQPPSVAPPAEPAPAPNHQPTRMDLSQASPDDLRLASQLLARLADAEAMHREASTELVRVRSEWQALEQKLLTAAMEAVA